LTAGVAILGLWQIMKRQGLKASVPPGSLTGDN
jgi:hypothetical protein